MSSITREEFASAVVAAISSVHHVYRALDRLLLELRQSLAEPPTPLTHVPGTFGKFGRDPARLVVRHEYGTLFRAVSDADEIEEDEDEEEEEEGEDGHDGDPGADEEDDEGDEPKHKHVPPSIAADEPLMALRVAMYDPSRQDSEPHLSYAVMTDWALKGQATTPGQQFLLPRYMLRRVPRALAGADPKAGVRLETPAQAKVPGGKKGKGRGRITCRLPMGVEVVPLYDLEEMSAVVELAARMKRMWAAAIEKSSGTR